MPGLIVRLLHTLYKGDHQTEDNAGFIASGWEGYTDGCKQHSEGSNWYYYACMPFLGVH